MNIGITQTQMERNGVVYDCLDPRWYSFFYPHSVMPLPNITDISVDHDLLVISGGDHSYDRNITEMERWNECILNNIPIIGICHGAFFLNYMHDGINQEIKEHKNTEHKIIMNGDVHVVNSYHTTGIFELGEDLEPIAVCEEDGSIEAFKHRSRDIWGLVWHPERMVDPILPEDIKALMNE